MTLEFNNKEVELLYDALRTKHREILDEIHILSNTILPSTETSLKLSNAWDELENINKIKAKVLEVVYDV